MLCEHISPRVLGHGMLLVLGPSFLAFLLDSNKATKTTTNAVCCTGSRAPLIWVQKTAQNANHSLDKFVTSD